MIRALLLCALSVGALGIDLSEDAPVAYAQRTRDVVQAKKVLDDALNKSDYNVRDPALHYLVMVGVVYETAKVVAMERDYPQHVLVRYLGSLRQVVPNILDDPEGEAAQVQGVANATLSFLSPLLSLVEKTCDNLGDDECNKVVGRIVEQRPELQLPSAVLGVAGKVAGDLLAKQQRLEEVAESLDVLPYLLDNRKYVVDYIGVLVDLLQIPLDNKA